MSIASGVVVKVNDFTFRNFLLRAIQFSSESFAWRSMSLRRVGIGMPEANEPLFKPKNQAASAVVQRKYRAPACAQPAIA